MSEHVIHLEGVTKRFGQLTAVDDVTVDVAPGRCFAWLGPNGCGKTTLIRMMLGLARSSGGKIEVCGYDVPHQTAAALAEVGGIVEEPRFYPYLSGRKNLQVWAAHYGDGAAERIDGALDRVRLLDRADEAVKTYSLGMRQRLGVARALLNDPKLLILDEPTNGLDPAGLAEFRELIRSFVDEGRSVFISSHILSEVQKMADDVAIIQKGKMVAFGSVDELVSGGSQKIYVRTTDVEAAAALLHGSQFVGTVATDEHGGLTLTVQQADDATLMKTGETLFGAGIAVVSLYPLQESLEQRFLDITGGEAVL
ncbi:MAG: ABC transporter ATP-binding protein [Solirubrobacterales bacterium]|nr:ABC transporter ATP-binding protein [Solirubrobacterales bacterium]